VHALLGGAHRERLELHGSVGWEEDPDAVAAVAETQAREFHTLKLYAGRGALADDLDKLRAARRRVGPEHPFIVDVNGQWTADEAVRAAPVLRELGVTMVEQPVSPADRAGQAAVTERYTAHGIDAAADERIRTLADLREVAGAALAGCTTIGVSKLGGIVAAFDAAMLARALELRVVVGSVVELGVATAAGMHFAAAVPELAHPSYLMGPLKYERQITFPPLRPVGSSVAVPDGPGLGIALDEEAVAAMDLRA
jgi:muconate cycloisomerase